MAKSPLEIRQIEGKESALQYEAESEAFLSGKDKNKRMFDFMSRLSRYKSFSANIASCFFLSRVQSFRIAEQIFVAFKSNIELFCFVFFF